MMSFNKKEENNERQGSIFDENKDNTLMTKRPKTGVADNKLAHVRKVLETIYNFNGVKSHKI
jgi:DNA repair protein RadC